MVKCKPSIICLDNGMQLIAGIVSESETHLETTIPLEVTRVKISSTHEALSLRPWIAFTDSEFYFIKQDKIISISPLSQHYEEGFYKMTEGYMEDKKEGLDFMDAMDDFEPEFEDGLSIEEFMNSLKDKGNDQIH